MPKPARTIERVVTHTIHANIKVEFDNYHGDFAAECGRHKHRGKTEEEAINNLIIFVKEQLNEQFNQI